MSLTFNLILALFLLAPGLGLFAGVYTGGRPPFRPAAAEPGSIHALALVSIGALFCHALCAWFFVGMQAWCDAGLACRAVSFDPNPYEIMLQLRETLGARGGTGVPVGSPLSPTGVAWLFTSLLIIGFVGFLLGLALVAFIGWSGLLRSTVYGWVAELLDGASTKAHVFTAFVLTDSEKDGLLLGYEGSLIDLRQSPSGEIRIVVLKDAEPFVVQMKEGSARRQREDAETGKPGKTISVLTIEGAHIKNIAFRPYLDPRRLTEKQYNRMKDRGELDVLPEPLAAEPVMPEDMTDATAAVASTRRRRRHPPKGRS